MINFLESLSSLMTTSMKLKPCGVRADDLWSLLAGF